MTTFQVGERVRCTAGTQRGKTGVVEVVRVHGPEPRYQGRGTRYRVAVDSAPELFWEAGENLVAAPRDIVSQSRHTPEQRQVGLDLLMGKRS